MIRCKAARRCSGPSSARQRARTVAVPCLTSLFPRGPHVLVPAACSRPCLALPWHRRRRCRARVLTPPVPAITRGLPAPPRTAPPTPWRFTLIRLGAPASDWRLGTSRGCNAHVALAPRKLPRRWRRPHRGLPASWWSVARSRHRRWGCAVLPVCGRRSQALCVQHGHARAWWSWRGLTHTLGVRHPQTPASRSGLWFEWSFTAGLCAAIGMLWKASHGRGALADGRSSGAAPLACVCSLRFFLLEGNARYAALAPASRPGSFRCASVVPYGQP